jgi:hypothetical protein
MNEYEDHWITTASGKKLHFRDPREGEIDIKDIAHGLALCCRFNGQCKTFYSVAEHSIRVADNVPDIPVLKLRALLHDAHEAYLSDVPRPIKADMPQYKAIADHLQFRIHCKFNCTIENEDMAGYCNGAVKNADDIMLSTEKEFLMVGVEDWAKLPTPLPRFKPMPWQKAEKLFLKRFNDYCDWFK